MYLTIDNKAKKVESSPKKIGRNCPPPNALWRLVRRDGWVICPASSFCQRHACPFYVLYTTRDVMADFLIFLLMV